MKQYLLSIYQPYDGPAPPKETLERIMQDVRAVREQMQASGAWVFAGGLYPPESASVVRLSGKEVLTTDGPFAETKEHIGGVSVILASDLDAALEWARKLARATTLPIEVRPFREESAS